MHTNERHLYLIHQTASDHLDLLLWNPRTKETQKVLLSRFTPAGLQVLPEGKGFSFIDHDTLRVKMHHKRSPQLINFEEPLYDLTLISWLNNTTFYFSAQNNANFGIYQASLQGHCDCIIASEEYDCMYPQKIGNALFYIERDKELSHKVVFITYPQLSYHESDPVLYINHQRKTEFIKKEYYCDISKYILLELGKKGIAFLHMINEFEGFFVEHPLVVDKHDLCIPFLYHYMYCTKEGQWKDKVVFSFSIPTNYLMPLDGLRLYESMLPFLPRYIHDKGLLFVNYDVDKMLLGLWLYDNKSQKIISYIQGQKDQSFFGIFLDNGIVYYGGVVSHDEKILPRMWLKNGILCVDLPFIPSKSTFF